MTSTQTEFTLVPSRQRYLRSLLSYLIITLPLAIILQLAIGGSLDMAISITIGAAIAGQIMLFIPFKHVTICIRNGFLEGADGRERIGIPLQNLDLERTISYNAKRKFPLDKVIWSTDNQKIVLGSMMYNHVQYKMLLEKLHNLVKQEE